jgi:hypothetical protein
MLKEKPMSRSFRHVLRGVHGRVRANYNLAFIRSTSVVTITAAQITALDPTLDKPFREVGEPGQDFRYHLGDANVWVSNVSPHYNDHYANEPGGVEYILHVDWPDPLDIAVTITIDDRFPESIDPYAP